MSNDFKMIIEKKPKVQMLNEEDAFQNQFFLAPLDLDFPNTILWLFLLLALDIVLFL